MPNPSFFSKVIETMSYDMLIRKNMSLYVLKLFIKSIKLVSVHYSRLSLKAWSHRGTDM